jgi:pyocin large subunit-like protein
MKRLWIAVCAVALGLGTACDPAPPPNPPAAATVVAAIPTERATPAANVRRDVGFRSRQRLGEHFARHGAEFGHVSRDEYLRRAQTLRDTLVGGDILELRRDDGTVSRFDRKSGAFVAFDADGTIRTFFRPNDGEAYFQRQARRRSDG